MFPLTHARALNFAVFGLGKSGWAVAQALRAGGAWPFLWDDAAEQLEAAERAGFLTYDLRQKNWPRFEALILAPGVPLTHPEPHWVVQRARREGVPILGDLALFERERIFLGLRPPTDAVFAPSDLAHYALVLAITGTNGKSTTTALLAHCLTALNYRTAMGGNIGTAVCLLPPLQAGRIFVLECSSFQIECASCLRPDIAVHLNLTPDHLDRHGTLENYAGIKESLLRTARFALVGCDDAPSREMAFHLKAAGVPFAQISCQNPVKEGVFARGRLIYQRRGGQESLLCDLSTHPLLLGKHNMQNVAAVAGVLTALGEGSARIQEAVCSFKGLAHRLENVTEIGGVRLVNDSKATNADSTQHALASFEKIYWIAGGLAKSGGIASLSPYFPKIAKAYLIGRDALVLAAPLEGHVPFVFCEKLAVAVEEAVRDALTCAHPEKAVVLLSPACASLDQYRNFEERGEEFRRCALSLRTAYETKGLRGAKKAEENK